MADHQTSELPHYVGSKNPKSLQQRGSLRDGLPALSISNHSDHVERIFPSPMRNGNRNSQKYKINCQEKLNTTKDTKNWLELLKQIEHDSRYYKIYEALLENRKHIIAKIGSGQLEKEYEIEKELGKLKLPTYLTFFCVFSCLDNISELTRWVCKEKGDRITILLMPFIDGGQVDKYKWTRENFDVLKNIIKHVFISSLYSARKIGFLHCDLHLGNILLKKSQRAEISYDDLGVVSLKGLLPILMDYDRAKIDKNMSHFVYKDLRKMILLLSAELDILFDSHRVVQLLDYFFMSRAEITKEVSIALCKEIDNLEIQTVFSERQALPNWLKPVKN